MEDSDSDTGPARLHQDQPFDESLDVPDSEEVASIYTPSPRVPPGGKADFSGRGETPPDSRMSSNDDEDDQDRRPPDLSGAHQRRCVRTRPGLSARGVRVDDGRARR